MNGILVMESKASDQRTGAIDGGLRDISKAGGTGGQRTFFTAYKEQVIR